MTLSHKQGDPIKPARIVVLGAAAYWGDACSWPARLPASRRQDWDHASSISRHPAAGAQLAQRLRPRDVLVFLAALTPDKGRDSSTLMRNLAMGRAVCEATGRSSSRS